MSDDRREFIGHGPRPFPPLPRAFYDPGPWLWIGPELPTLGALERKELLAGLRDLGPHEFLYVITDEVNPHEPR